VPFLPLLGLSPSRSRSGAFLGAFRWAPGGASRHSTGATGATGADPLRFTSTPTRVRAKAEGVRPGILSGSSAGLCFSSGLCLVLAPVLALALSVAQGAHQPGKCPTSRQKVGPLDGDPHREGRGGLLLGRFARAARVVERQEGQKWLRSGSRALSIGKKSWK
jgi:hypothetical protein